MQKIFRDRPVDWWNATTDASVVYFQGKIQGFFATLRMTSKRQASTIVATVGERVFTSNPSQARDGWGTHFVLLAG
jgi:hypothetical protein